MVGCAAGYTGNSDAIAIPVKQNYQAGSTFRAITGGVVVFGVHEFLAYLGDSGFHLASFVPILTNSIAHLLPRVKGLCRKQENLQTSYANAGKLCAVFYTAASCMLFSMWPLLAKHGLKCRKSLINYHRWSLLVSPSAL